MGQLRLWSWWENTCGEIFSITSWWISSCVVDSVITPRYLLTYDLWSTINVQGFFSDFAGNLRARKPNKAQTKRSNITVVQYILVFFLSYAHMNRSGVNFVLSCLSFLSFTSSSFSSTYLFLSSSARVCLHQQSTHPPWFRRACKCIWPRLSPTSKRGQYNNDYVPRRCQPLLQPPRLRWWIHNLAFLPPTNIPPPQLWQSFFSHRQWVE